MKKMYTRRILIILLAASLFISIAGCSAAQPAQSSQPPKSSNPPQSQASEPPKVTEVKVGYTTLKSGPLAAIGFYIDAAVNIALEDFNAKSDVKVVLVPEDAGSTVETANDATVRLIDDKVSAIVAIVAPDQYTAMLPELEDANIPVMVTAAPDEIFTYGYDWLFSAYVTKEQENYPTIAWAQKMGVKSVALLIGTDDTSKALAKYFQEKAAPLGITFYVEHINGGDNDYTANITSARRNNPEAYCVLAGDADLAKILRQMKQLGITEPLNTGGAILVQQFLDRMEPEEIEGLYGQASIMSPQMSTDPRVAEFSKKYTQITQAPPDIISLVSYDAAMLAFEASTATGGDPQKIKEYLRGLKDWNGVSGIFNYDERGLGRHEAYLFQAGKDKKVELIGTMPIDE